MLAKVPLVQVLVEAIESQLHVLNVFTKRIFLVSRRFSQTLEERSNHEGVRWWLFHE